MSADTLQRRTFWWDRARPVDADVAPLRAVIFDADDALADAERDGDLVPRAGLIDLVMNLFVAGIWIGVVSIRERTWAQTLVRQLIGEGLVETIVTADDLDGADGDAELYRLALWEFGITPESTLAVEGSARGLRAAAAAGLPALLVTTGDSAESEFTGAAAVRSGYDGAHPLLAAGCRELHRRWWIARKRSQLVVSS
ncbi:HAD hydrolase-like protein [uncultured Mycobacterium sp.]|uniref:HAD hydrolase-like protein n=1 Tax=uncultured Mycobacterium sp. TaxID=171292 RepID=UPI0035CA84D0